MKITRSNSTSLLNELKRGKEMEKKDKGKFYIRTVVKGRDRCLYCGKIAGYPFCEECGDKYEKDYVKRRKENGDEANP